MALFWLLVIFQCDKQLLGKLLMEQRTNGMLFCRWELTRVDKFPGQKWNRVPGV